MVGFGIKTTLAADKIVIQIKNQTQLEKITVVYRSIGFHSST